MKIIKKKSVLAYCNRAFNIYIDKIALKDHKNVRIQLDLTRLFIESALLDCDNLLCKGTCTKKVTSQIRITVISPILCSNGYDPADNASHADVPSSTDITGTTIREIAFL